MVDRSIERIDRLLQDLERLSPEEERKLAQLLQDAAQATGLTAEEVTAAVGSLASATQTR